MSEWVRWSTAIERALMGPAGFYLGEGVPAEHFRTSVVAAPELMAEAISTMLDDLRADLGVGPEEGLDVVDLGAGGGELLTALARVLPERERLHGVDVALRPAGLPARVRWSRQLPVVPVGLVMAHEYLDNVPIDVAEVGPDAAVHLVLVDPATGDERLGEHVDTEDAAWLRRWWPIEGAPRGTRAEIGRARDAAWSSAVCRLRRGIALAIDYDHQLDTRPTGGTLTGYRHGRLVAPTPDGSCDITAHVALDACAAAGVLAGASASSVIRQADALRALAITAPRPPMALAHEDPLAYLQALSRAGSVAELLDPIGLGAFGWLVQVVGVGLPDRLTRIG